MNKLMYFFGGIIFTLICSATLMNSPPQDSCSEVNITKKILLSLASDYQENNDEARKSVVVQTLYFLKNKLTCNGLYDSQITRAYSALIPVYIQGINIPPKLGDGTHHEVIDDLFTRLNDGSFNLDELRDLLIYDRLLDGQDIDQGNFKTELFKTQFLLYKLSPTNLTTLTSEEFVEISTLLNKNAEFLEVKSDQENIQNTEPLNGVIYEFEKYKTFKYKFPVYTVKDLENGN